MSTSTLLPHAAGYVTDGGMETDLIFHHGVDLPEFAAFPLLDDSGGRALLRTYYDGYAAIAAATGAGLLLESPTWRASTDWGPRVGYDQAALDRINVDAVHFLASIAQDWRARVAPILLVGTIGPRGDGYRASDVEPDEAAAYHLPQVRALARGGADLINAYTMAGVGEATGVALAARTVGIPVGIAFTVETDGRLPDGTPLHRAIAAVDAVSPPAHFGVNCAHPSHISAGLVAGASELSRVAVVRANASELSHAELDQSDELDDGDPAGWADDLHRLRDLLPSVRVIGGCCGTDARHVAAMWGVAA
ncbi:MAG: homocysteine S-methyltransferase family protein [Micropruina sp.]|nr:homocysteine S-methyltransferase family protein [Micropruina sp.]